MRVLVYYEYCNSEPMTLQVHTFPKDEGPCVRAVDKTLCECRVER